MAPEAAVSVFDTHVFFAETTEFQRPKIHVPNSVVDLLQADILAGAGLAEVDPGTAGGWRKRINEADPTPESKELEAARTATTHDRREAITTTTSSNTSAG